MQQTIGVATCTKSHCGQEAGRERRAAEASLLAAAATEVGASALNKPRFLRRWPSRRCTANFEEELVCRPGKPHTVASVVWCGAAYAWLSCHFHVVRGRGHCVGRRFAVDNDGIETSDQFQFRASFPREPPRGSKTQPCAARGRYR